jgi:hypothetical protein
VVARVPTDVPSGSATITVRFPDFSGTLYSDFAVQ